MRINDLRGGSLKALLIFLLVVANIVAATIHETARTRRAQALDPQRPERVTAENHPH